MITTSYIHICCDVRRISSFNASRELPFDLEDSLLLWINKVCSALNSQQLKKQKVQAEQLLLNQDKAKRFRFRRDQLQPKVQSTFPSLEDLLKDISDGQCLLGIVLFYQPQALDIQGLCDEESSILANNNLLILSNAESLFFMSCVF